MADVIKAKKLDAGGCQKPKQPVIGVFSPCDPRIDADSRQRAQNITKIVADAISGKVLLPGGKAVDVVYSDILKNKPI